MSGLFFTTEAPLSSICINDIDDPFAIAQRLICFKLFGPFNTLFYMLARMTRSVQRLLDENGTGMTARGIKAPKLKTIPLPVSPEAEQAGIVSKVEELMVVFDSEGLHEGGSRYTTWLGRCSCRAGGGLT